MSLPDDLIQELKEQFQEVRTKLLSLYETKKFLAVLQNWKNSKYFVASSDVIPTSPISKSYPNSSGNFQAHDVRTTLLRRHFNVLTSYQRPYNVVLTLCARLVPLILFYNFVVVLASFSTTTTTTTKRQQKVSIS